ncbi:MAG TPA: hypothetical protein VGM90_05605 [Kofleriaceae bacterium]
MIECSCGEKFDPAPPPGTPCRICGTPVGTPPDEDLKVDPEWELERARKQAAAATVPKPRNLWSVILTLVLVAALGTIVVMVMQRSPHTRGGMDIHAGVEITVTADEQTKITVDGSPAGMTPVTLKLSGGKQPITIVGGGKKVVVTPDHDQVVKLK